MFLQDAGYMSKPECHPKDMVCFSMVNWEKKMLQNIRLDCNIENSHLSSMVYSALGQAVVAIGVQELVMCDRFCVLCILNAVILM